MRILPLILLALTGCVSVPSQDAPDETQGGAPLTVRNREDGCMDIEREPGGQGGFRAPRQIVCPPFSPAGDDHK